MTLSEPLVLVFCGEVRAMNELLPVLEIVAKLKRPIFVLASKIDGEAHATLLVNALKGNLKCVPVCAPGFGSGKTGRMSDFAILTRARLIDPERGDRLDSVTLDDLGSADAIVVSKHWTEVRRGAGDAREIATQTERLRRLAADTSVDFEREKLLERIAELDGRRLTISVGGATTGQREQNRDGLVQALASIAAASVEGVIEGGASILAREALGLRDSVPGGGAEAAQIVAAGMLAPLSTLVRNARSDLPTVLEKVSNRTQNMVFDASSDRCVSAGSSHILEPAAILTRAVAAATAATSRFLRTATWTPQSRADVTSLR